eukprot:TRINITY_DN24973_c0_g1_i3.p1 TRINITY_DN24973_c0_g1~~TRINITY_DN24973_c0_g1_i3.p1  ORF type:complete len:460 (+),score=45.33 TRINITY_DN24973_c0_g1_i3:73-1452(+)
MAAAQTDDDVMPRSLLARACGPMNDGSLRGCTLSLTFSALGAGILSLPWAFAQLGLGAGLAALTACALFSYATMEMIIYSGLKLGAHSYAGTMGLLLGSGGRVAVDTVVMIDCAGAICVRYRYMASSLQLLGAALGFEWSTEDIIVAMCACVILPLSLPKQLTVLRYLAALSAMPLAFVIGLILVRSSTLARQWEGPPLLVTEDLTSGTSLQAWAAIFFSFMCHMNVWPVRNELRAPTPARTSKVFRRTVCVLFFVYAAVAVAGYLSFRDSTPADILSAYPTSEPASLCAHVLISAMLVVSSVLCIHPVRSSLAALCGYRPPGPPPDTVSTTTTAVPSDVSCSPSRKTDDSDSLAVPLMAEVPEEVPTSDALSELGPVLHKMLTLLIVIGTCIVAVAVPSVVTLISFLGGFCVVLLVFIFPCFLFLRTQPGALSASAAMCAFAFSAIGLGASFSSFSFQ